MPTLKNIEVHIDDLMEALTDEQLRREYIARFKDDPPLTEATDPQVEEAAQNRLLFPAERTIDDFSDEEIEHEYRERHRGSIEVNAVADELYRTRADVPQIVKDWLYQETGRTLP